MATAISKAGTSLIPVIGLLLLAGMVSRAGPAWAQLECPLPAGVTPPSLPRVTAQEVEDGSASLADFALAAKGQLVNDSQGVTTVRQAAYTGCLIRQEGSPWRSGSTYLVQLTPDGRVLVHAKDMSLSGRRLNPAVYGAVFHALGINPAALADPAAAFAAFTAAAAGDGGPFNVASLPGASGYANVYMSVNLRIPIILLTGLDLAESHLVPISEENIDYGSPAIVARDVVDRETLKAFVTAAGRYVIGHLESEDLAATAKARIALRDPDGPWRHGPVYVVVMERASRLILFHGAFPDRFEFRQGGITRDIATGELVVEQLIDAAESGPEGGYWLYHFDNPADDTDSAETPKVGYARIFTRLASLPDGTVVPTDYILNSGFYLTPEGDFVQRLLAALDDGQVSLTFGITAPVEGDAVSGDAVDVTVEGAPTDTVHFAYRLAGAADEPFTYAGAAANREAVASFAWDTLDLPDDDYELAALYTEDHGHSVIYDVIETSVDNVDDGGNGGNGGGGGCAVAPPLAGGGPPDPTLPALVGLALASLMLRRRRGMRQACGRAGQLHGARTG